MTMQTDTPQQQRNAIRLRRVLAQYRLWAMLKGKWADMTNAPLMWYANKAAGAKVARAKIDRRYRKYRFDGRRVRPLYPN